MGNSKLWVHIWHLLKGLLNLIYIKWTFERSDYLPPEVKLFQWRLRALGACGIFIYREGGVVFERTKNYSNRVDPRILCLFLSFHYKKEKIDIRTLMQIEAWEMSPGPNSHFCNHKNELKKKRKLKKSFVYI